MKIPNNTSALMVFANNSVSSEDRDYREDGWVYNDQGEKIKKWYKRINDILVWFPIMDDIIKIEERLKVQVDRARTYHNKILLPVYEELKKVGKAHAKVTHKYSGDMDPYWLYTYNNNKGERSEGISFKWVDKPEDPLNLGIGNAYYNYDNRFTELSTRAGMFKSILEHSIKRKTYDIPGNYGEQLCINVNESYYWFVHGGHTWEPLSFPDNKAKFINIKK